MALTHGRCYDCGVIFYWHGWPLLRTAFCPRCGWPLARTAASLARHIPVVNERPTSSPTVIRALRTRCRAPAEMKARIEAARAEARTAMEKPEETP